ncbi:MAG TPA: Clp protease N-terminal domain-containing protein [Candidatus Acidoferrum sp.]|nr:Clp protease N-terminal domain-containing protein [Candidatus Acidoferrum sp.]
MFERYTERAWRVIFFARYEASQYGSPYIETEHLLLGLMREDRALSRRFLAQGDVESGIRADIERRITRGERLSISVEMPLTADSKKALNLAAEEAERLGSRHVSTEHFLLGMLRVDGCFAAELLRERGLELKTVREQLAKDSSPTIVKPRPAKQALLTLDSFLAGLKWHKSEELAAFFAKNAQLVDVSGKRWNRAEIVKQFETLFAPYAKKNATYIIEETLADTKDLLVATVLWKNAILASMQRVWVHRMSAVLVLESEEWTILLAQVTPVQLP